MPDHPDPSRSETDPEPPRSKTESESGRPGVIVVGYASGAEGRAALKRAITEAGLRGSSLIVVDMSADAELDTLRAELDATGVVAEIRTATDTQDPAEDLLAAAEDGKADFIVIGLRRRSPVGKLLLGSNAQRVLLDAACPVLAVKADPA